VVLDIADAESGGVPRRSQRYVTIVVNNAGISTGTAILGDPALLRREMDTISSAQSRDQGVRAGPQGKRRCYVCERVVDTVVVHGAGRRLRPGQGGAWSASNAMRLELLDQGTRVLAVTAGR